MRVLINLLECMDFKLTQSDLQNIRQQFQANNNQQVYYKEVLNCLSYDKNINKWILADRPGSQFNVSGNDTATEMSTLNDKLHERLQKRKQEMITQDSLSHYRTRQIDQDEVKSKVSLYSTANKNDDIEVGDSVSQVGSSFRNKSTLNIMNKYVKNMPRHTYDESEPKVSCDS